MRRLVLNATLGPATRARRDPERALAAWLARAGAIAEAADAEPDAEDYAFVDDLGVLLRAFAGVPGLTPVGWTAQLREAEQRLENRLRVKWIHARNPRVGAEAIERPVFIVGLPRTAAGLVHRILARSEPHRAPMLWELLRTGADGDDTAAQRSLDTVSRQLEALDGLGSAGRSAEPQRADWPGESTAVLWRTWRPLRCAHLPEYRAWLDQADATGDYVHLKQVLQVLQYGRTPRRWILRFPGDVARLDLVRRVFPDAVFVWTKRDPATALASFCSVVEALTVMHCKEVDPERIGRTWLGLLAEGYQRGRKLRRSLPADAVADLNYHRLVFDPHRYAPDLYDRIGAEWTHRDAMGLNEITGPANRPARRVDLGRYGLTEAAVAEAFADTDPALEVFTIQQWGPPPH
ncbi:sulfotransferase family protein [Glycomyces paridis]|uniref:Sulfotransferase n=1 Tax=Glycomyces paridis TaxID=2126555 RepID=A0A4V4HNY9_9ACTN|nr:sulfotransferase [Glycomyces paridis]THV27896.1 sulfotransferase [Glycomyces paridis]